MNRVLHVHSGNMFGGIERMLETIVAHPVTAVHDVALCYEGRLSSVLRAHGTRVLRLPAIRSRRPDQVWEARRILDRCLMTAPPAAVVFHSSWAQALFGPVVRRYPSKLVRWLHSPERGPWWQEVWARRTRPDLLLCNSRYTLNVASGWPDDVPRVVQYPPAAPFPPTSPDRRIIRQELDEDPEATVVVMAARIEGLKGHELFLEALERLKHLDGWRAWIVGGAHRRRERQLLMRLVKRVRRAGLESRVRFLGERDDVWQVLSAADIFCQPNVRPDAFGLSLVEALSAGLPVVTSAMGGAMEIVDGTCGVLVDDPSPGAFAKTLETLFLDSSRRRAMSVAARERAQRLCDPVGSVHRLDELLLGSVPDHQRFE